MACLELGSSHIFSSYQVYDVPFDLHLDDSVSVEFFDVPDASKPSLSCSGSSSVPKPPSLPRSSNGRCSSSKRLTGYSYVPDETRHAWDKLFHEGYEADVHVLTDDKCTILAHSCVLGISSAVMRNLLVQAKIRGGIRCIKIRGVPSEAANVFVRFLYSSSYDPDDMKNYVLHLLVMSHSYSIPSLKKACINQLEQQALLNAENVVDVLQLARQCDAPRLSVLCTRMIMKDFKTISLSEGWKVMRKANPELEQELLESLVEADSKRQEKMKKMEERKVYSQLHEAMEALVHICRDGCRTIGPSDKVLKDSQVTCKFPACKGLESLVRHFSGCKTRVPGGCTQCKRMWQLFELHSRMCSELGFCKVPLCRHFKDKIKNQSRKEEMKWSLLSSKVIAVKGTLSSISSRRIFVP